jgi:hypothetical protein
VGRVERDAADGDEMSAEPEQETVHKIEAGYAEWWSGQMDGFTEACERVASAAERIGREMALLSYRQRPYRLHPPLIGLLMLMLFGLGFLSATVAQAKPLHCKHGHTGPSRIWIADASLPARDRAVVMRP